jgi:PAS domain-containing protein
MDNDCSSNNKASRRTLPDAVVEAVRSLSWSLRESSPLLLQPMERLVVSPTLRTGEGVFSTIRLLQGDATTRSDNNNNNNNSRSDAAAEQWARVATALLLLGHGYADHAHNLVGPLSFPQDLDYFEGPPVVCACTDICAAASYTHCLVHRWEGHASSEFQTTGFENSHFWAGATARSGGEESLPLSKMGHAMEALAVRHGPLARQWLHQKAGLPACEWDARPLTQLCAHVLAVSEQRPTHEGATAAATVDHPLHQFAQEAALLEVQLLLQHALEKLGFDTTNPCWANPPAVPHPQVLADDWQTLVPQTYRQALQIQHEAVVITTAAKPHTICYVNAAWEELCGYSSREALHETFLLLQGPDTNRNMAGAMVQRCQQTRLPQHEYLVNYTRAREPFLNHLCIGFLSGTGTSSGDNNDYMVGIMQKVERMPGVAAS